MSGRIYSASDRKRKREYDRTRRANPTHRDREQELQRARRANPTHRDREQELQRARRANPTYREREREHARVRRMAPAYREREHERERARQANPAYQKYRRELGRSRYAKNPQYFRDKLLRYKLKYDPQYLTRIAARLEALRASKLERYLRWLDRAHCGVAAHLRREQNHARKTYRHDNPAQFASMERRMSRARLTRTLHDEYIKKLLAKGYGIPYPAITKSLIAAKREHLRTKRLIMEKTR